jgi:FkbM family methyltransferase
MVRREQSARSARSGKAGHRFVKQAIKQLLDRMGYRIEGTHYTPHHLYRSECLRALQFDDVICRYMFDHGEICNFIQVGAYDGISTDPLRRYVERCRWRGVMLEPQPGPAAQLRHLYTDNPNIVIIEAAVDSKHGTRTLYTVDCETLPKWAGGMASFDRGQILRQDYLIPGIEKYLRELQVDCIPFSEVIDAHPDGSHLDILQIDAEGADGRILSWFPFDKMKPAIVHWEVKNMTKQQQEKALDLLCSQGYLIARSGDEDMLALLH